MLNEKQELSVKYLDIHELKKLVGNSLKTKIVRYGYYETDIYGHKMMVVLCVYDDSLMALGFCGDKRNQQDAIDNIKGQFRFLCFEHDDAYIKQFAKRYCHHSQSLPIDIVLIGTPYQHCVWKALIHTKIGEVMSYSEFTQKLGKDPKIYTRSVSTVGIAKNPVSFFVPCHRIVNKDRKTHNYRWGVGIKDILIHAEDKMRNIV